MEAPWRAFFRIVGFRIDIMALCEDCGSAAILGGWTATDPITIDAVKRAMEDR